MGMKLSLHVITVTLEFLLHLLSSRQFMTTLQVAQPLSHLTQITYYVSIIKMVSSMSYRIFPTKNPHHELFLQVININNMIRNLLFFINSLAAQD